MTTPLPGYVHAKGEYAARFAGVADAFERIFTEHGEVGAALAIYHRNELVVDLWGGVRDRASGAPWQRDTIACMMSVAKGISMICVAMLADRGLLSLDDRMAQHWPEFGAHGKDQITVRQALGHLACIPVTDLAKPGDIYDERAMIDAIAGQAPLWPPGTAQVYHSSTLGFMAGELVRRLTGRSIGQFLRRNIQEPLDADYYIGLTEAEALRCATIIPSAGNVVSAAKHEPEDSILFRMWKSLPVEETFNSDAWRRNEIPSVNGHGTARGVAAIYNALAAGRKAGATMLVAESTLAPFLVEQIPSPPPAEAGRLHMAVGFMLNSPPHRAIGPNPRAFGHSGAGGAQGFADADAELSFCWATNKYHDGSDTVMRAASLIDAAYAAIA